MIMSILQHCGEHYNSDGRVVSGFSRTMAGYRFQPLNLTVKDSGAGFDPPEAMRGPGLGLTSMSERLKVIGGQLSMHSQRGHGTIIHRDRASLSPSDVCQSSPITLAYTLGLNTRS